jgi:hypothetical protein
MSYYTSSSREETIPVDLDFGHGFIPRIGEDNYKAVDRCVGPTDLFSSSLDLPWAIVDGAWAEQKPALLGTLREHRTKLLIDTHGWRFRYDAALNVEKLRSASWAPTSAVSPVDKVNGAALVEASLRAQSELEADVYFVPGWLPRTPDEDLRPAYDQIVATASRFNDVPAKPFVLFVGAHTKGLEHVARLLDGLPHFISGIYLQATPVHPVKDGPSKLGSLAALYAHAASLGFKVIAGHAGAVTPELRALGVDAADAGLAVGEAFDQSPSRRPAVPETEGKQKRGGRRSRMYFGQIGRSLEAADVERLLEVPGAAAELRGCRLPCHRFSGHHMLEQAREHSLWARVEEAQLVASLPPSMRATSVYERLKGRRSVLATINGALDAAGEEPLDVKPLDNHLAWISRALAARSAA